MDKVHSPSRREFPCGCQPKSRRKPCRPRQDGAVCSGGTAGLDRPRSDHSWDSWKTGVPQLQRYLEVLVVHRASERTSCQSGSTQSVRLTSQQQDRTGEKTQCILCGGECGPEQGQHGSSVCCPHNCHFNAPAQGDPPKAAPKHMNKPTCSEATDKIGTGSQQRLLGDDGAVSTQLGRTQNVL